MKSGSPRTEALRNELFSDIADRSIVILIEHGLSEHDAQKVADVIVDDIAENWGGQHIAIPKDMKYRHAKRCEMIKADFNGNNHRELAKKYNLTVNSIYKILKRN